MDKTPEGLHAELRAFEERLGVLLQETNDKEVPAPDLPLTSENVEELQCLVEEDRRPSRRLPVRSNG